jgi:hypothetical protein
MLNKVRYIDVPSIVILIVAIGAPMIAALLF